MISQFHRLRSLYLVCFLLFACCCAVVVVNSSLQRVHASTNGTLTNPGFEDPYATVSPAAGSQQNISGQIANGWSDDTAWTSDTLTYAEDTSVYHGGLASQRVDIQAIPATQAFQFRQQLSLSAGQLYTASVWLRSSSSMLVQVRLQLANAPYTSLTDGQVQLSPNQWTQASATGQTPTANVFFQIRTLQTGTLWIDDAALTSTPAPALTPPTGTIPRSYFGQHIKSASTPWPAVDFGTLRLWGSNVDWSALEPSRGTYDFSALDSWVHAAQQHDADIVLTLAVTPQWASERPNEYASIGHCSAYPDCGGAAPPSNIQDWKDFVSTVANRYKGQIHYYEIWNEPDLTNFFTGTPTDLFNLASSAYTVLKGVDSNIQVISPPFSNSVGWLNNFLALGGANYADIIGFHFYATDNPEYLPIQIANVRQVMQQYQLTQPLWDTEGASGTSQTPDLQGAGFVARDYILNWAAGASRFIWYAWDNHDDYPGDAPLVQGDNATLTRAATAYAVIENWLTGSQMVSVSTDGNNTWTVQLTRPDGSTSWIIWNPTTALAYPIPANWHVGRMQDLYGLSSSLSGVNSVQVDGSPVLLEQTQPAIPTPPRPPAVTGINPLTSNQASSADLYGGGDCQTGPYYGGNVSSLDQQDWIKYSNVTLPANLQSFTASIQTFSLVNAHLQVILDPTIQPGCGLTNGGTLTGGTTIADLTVTPSSAQDFQGPFASETTSIAASYPPGQHDLYLLATGTIGNLGSIQFSASTMPNGWTSQDIGAVGTPGSAGYANGTFTVSSSGGDIWNTNDACTYASQSLTGDGQIVARIVSQSANSGTISPWAKAGVMMRNTLDSGSTEVTIALTPQHGTHMINRNAAEAASNDTYGPDVVAPYWLKLVRQGNTFTGSVSNDGTNWTQISSVTIAMNATISVGLAVTSNTSGQVVTAMFDQASIGPVS